MPVCGAAFGAAPVIGDDVIADFEGAGSPGVDVIDLRAYAGLGFGNLTFSSSVGNSVVITADAFEGSITLIGVSVLVADDFLF